MYINHAALKKQIAQWVQVKSFNVSAAAQYRQQLKILEDMFVVSIFLVTAYQHDDDEFVSKCN